MDSPCKVKLICNAQENDERTKLRQMSGQTFELFKLIGVKTREIASFLERLIAEKADP